MSTKITIADLTNRLGVTPEVAQKALDLMTGKADPTEYQSVNDWIDKCHYLPDDGEQVMEALNELLNGFGVEGITPDGEVHVKADYVNNGDTYRPTIVRDLETDEFMLCGWGDWLEGWEQEHQQEQADGDEEDDDNG